MTFQGKYINLFTDFGFKRVFGEEANKDILMDFLNQVLPTEYSIHDLHFSKNEHLGQTIENRKAVFDIYCISSKGEHFIVELQKARQDYFKDRSVYYASFPIQEMAQKGRKDGLDWNYQLSPIFTVGILNFAFKEGKENVDKLYHHVQLKDQDCQVFYDKLHFIYLELAKFNKPLEQCKSHFERWLWVFKNLPNLEEIPADLQEAVFTKLFKISEVAKFNAKEQEAYKTSLKHLWDLTNVVDTAFKDGETTGFEKGEAVGFEKGETAGQQLVLQIIRLYQQKNSLEEIAQKTNKSLAFVKQLLSEAGLLD
ncbi:MAG: Rpn family recombination-promoting nuclease/putative transposase [Bacteroidota bacterium]